MFDKLKSMLSFDRPARLLALFVGVTSVLWVVQASLLQNILPLDAVEAVVWGDQLQWGQMKSPPLSGWLAAAFWHLSGRGDWSLYLLEALTSAVGLWFVYKLAREFMDEAESATATLLLCFLYYYNPPAMKFCSHSTQIALLPAMTLYFVRALRGGKWRDWLLLAVFSALAMLGKYSAAQLLIAFGAVMLGTRIGRKRLLSPGPYLCAALFLALLAPHIVWLFDHDFLAIKHMDERMRAEGATWYLPFLDFGVLLYPFLNSAVGLAVGMLPWRKDQLERRETDKEALAILLPVALIPPGIYVLLSACGQALILQWFSYLAFPAGIVTMLLWPYRCGRREFKHLFLLLNFCIVILLIATTVDVMTKPRFKIHSEPDDIVAAGEAFWKRHGNGRPLEVVFGDRWLAGVMELYAPGHPSACDGRDVCTWELVRERAHKNGMLLVYQHHIPSELEFWPNVHPEGVDDGNCKIRFRARFGKTKRKEIRFAYVPPEAPPRKSDRRPADPARP